MPDAGVDGKVMKPEGPCLRIKISLRGITYLVQRLEIAKYLDNFWASLLLCFAATS